MSTFFKGFFHSPNKELFRPKTREWSDIDDKQPILSSNKLLPFISKNIVIGNFTTKWAWLPKLLRKLFYFRISLLYNFEIFSSHPMSLFHRRVSIFTLELKFSEHVFRIFFPLNENFECIFQIFSKFHLKILRKTSFEIFVQGQKWNLGIEKETWGWEEKFSITFLYWAL
jgi:hypothetical protein